MTRRALLPVCAALSAALLVAGCGDEEGPAASATSTSTSSAAPSPAPSPATSPAADDDAPAATPSPEEPEESEGDGGDGGGDGSSFPGDASPDTAAASAGAQVTVTGIRTGRHDGFDRVVLEADGTGTPGWDVRWVDAASSQGSGEPVAVAGGAVLQVALTGAGTPYDTGVDEYAGGPVAGQGTANVTEVVFDATFEGTTVAFVGARAEAPFRVYLLQDPVRVVVEVADAG
ncbi:AMIN-like domain-containing (lipo)protein [Geodermatophilus sp. SYSU D01119]